VIIIVCVKAKEGVGKVTTQNLNENSGKSQMVPQVPSSATVQNRQVLPNNKQQQPVKNKPSSSATADGRVSVSSNATISESQLRNVKTMTSTVRYVPAHMKAPFRTTPQYQKSNKRSAQLSQRSNKVPVTLQVSDERLPKETEPTQMSGVVANGDERIAVNTARQSSALLDKDEELNKPAALRRDITATTVRQPPAIPNTRTVLHEEHKPSADQLER
jgi:hypothetical protein